MGLIYKIEGPINIPDICKLYVGQTESPLNIRWNNHKTKFKYFAAGNTDHTYCIQLCKAVMKYNVDNFTITKIEDCEKSELDDREIHWINELDTIHPNGYNVYTGGYFKGITPRVIKDETREIISDITKSSKSKELNLPMYINYYIGSNGTRHGYKVCHAPSKVERIIMTPINEPLTDEMLNRAKRILQQLIDKYNTTLPAVEEPEEFVPVPFQYVKKASGLPTYINYYKNTRKGITTRHGYKIFHIPSKKCKYIMIPIDDPLTDEMLVNAKETLAIFIKEYNDSLISNLTDVLENTKI